MAKQCAGLTRDEIRNQLRSIVLVVKYIVDFPDDVRVDIYGGVVVVAELSVNQSDIPKVIGRGGQTMEALKTLVNAFAGKHRFQAILVLPEDKQRADIQDR